MAEQYTVIQTKKIAGSKITSSASPGKSLTLKAL